MIAQNAQAIFDQRMRGFRPADMVMVSLVGPVWTANPVVFAKVPEKYDWRWVRGLDVCVHINDDIDWPEMVKQIGLQRPSYLCVWNDVGKWGARMFVIPMASDIGKPMRMWKQELDFWPWMDFQNEDFMSGKYYDQTGQTDAHHP